VLRKVAEGCSNREIADACAIAESTVKHYLTALMQKTGAGNRVELTLFALHHHLVAGEQTPESPSRTCRWDGACRRAAGLPGVQQGRTADVSGRR
jgi:hypothetical protein